MKMLCSPDRSLVNAIWERITESSAGLAAFATPGGVVACGVGVAGDRGVGVALEVGIDAGVATTTLVGGSPQAAKTPATRIGARMQRI